jgi:hypothetical protein
MSDLPLQWMHTPEGAAFIRSETPFDPKSKKGSVYSSGGREWTLDCLLTPQNYLDLTRTTREELMSWSDKVEQYAEAMSQQLEAGRGEFPLPWLRIDWEDREVTGHEGRHRAAAAWTLKIPAIPVVLVLDPERYRITPDDTGLVRDLDLDGFARVAIQRHRREDPETKAILRFVKLNGRRAAMGYRQLFA